MDNNYLENLRLKDPALCIQMFKENIYEVMKAVISGVSIISASNLNCTFKKISDLSECMSNPHAW